MSTTVLCAIGNCFRPHRDGPYCDIHAFINPTARDFKTCSECDAPAYALDAQGQPLCFAHVTAFLRSCNDAATSAPASETIKAPADRFGTLVDTGLHAGDVVDVEVGGERFRRVILSASSQPREYVYAASQWQREIRYEPMVRVAPEGCPELWADVAVSRVVRLEAALTS